MIEVRGDLWKLSAVAAEPAKPGHCLRLIATNGQTRRDGAAVMGRGCAQQARDMLPGIDYKLGELLRKYGNRPFRLTSLEDGSHLCTFPVKHHWKEAADLDLIERSALQLVELVDRFEYQTVFLPRPGCGNGQLSYEQVRPVLEKILTGDGFVIVSY